MAITSVLTVLLVFVGVLQYRWVGDVSRAERERLHASLQSRAAELALAMDRDITRAYSAFQMEQHAFDADPAGLLSVALARAAQDSLAGTAVKAVFVAEAGSDTLQQFDAGARRLDTVPWPEVLLPIRQRLPNARRLGVPGLPLDPGFFPDAVDGAAPALVVPMSRTTPLPSPVPGGAVVVREANPGTGARSLIVWLDVDRARLRFVGPLVQRVFGDPSVSEFDVSVTARDTGTALFATGASPVDPDRADLTRDVLSLRLDDLHWALAAQPPGAPGPVLKTDRVAITIVRQGEGGPGATVRRDLAAGAWTMAIRAKRGSLEAIVERSRLRNLTVSLGVLALLGASAALLLVSSARAQRTARQQLAFVASVSHELRTPLAVIRSAGENLADGVVSGPQVATYGALVRDEGRRLSEMVDRVMDFAGLASGSQVSARRTVALAPILDAAVAALAPESAQRGVAVRVAHPAPVPGVVGDPAALTSAFQNIVGNAVKYSLDGGVIDVVTTVTGAGRVQVMVSDRGLGVDADDLPHVFEPFYRGRRAVESQVRGSGLGLSVVQGIVVAHGGTVRVGARSGGGTEVVVELPSAPLNSGEPA